jgi:Spy/CpxP family protein refolding chaperone
MNVHDNLRRITIAAAVAAAMTMGAGAALAQPVGGPHGQGAHGPGAPDLMIGHMIENAKAQLSLNTSQQVMFDAAVANSKVAHESGRALHQKVRDTLTTELAKAEPDLAAVAATADAAQQQGQEQRKSIRGQWLALYATFTPEQKAVVRDNLQKRMANAESFRARMQDRVKGFLGGKGG